MFLGPLGWLRFAWGKGKPLDRFQRFPVWHEKIVQGPILSILGCSLSRISFGWSLRKTMDSFLLRGQYKFRNKEHLKVPGRSKERQKSWSNRTQVHGGGVRGVNRRLPQWHSSTKLWFCFIMGLTMISLRTLPFTKIKSLKRTKPNQNQTKPKPKRTKTVSLPFPNPKPLDRLTNAPLFRRREVRERGRDRWGEGRTHGNCGLSQGRRVGEAKGGEGFLSCFF